MYVLSVVGPDAATAADRLVPALDGSVAVVERVEAVDDRPAADATYAVAPDGAWRGSGTDRSLDRLVDDLAPAHDHALVVGEPSADLPAVALGDADPAGDVLVRAESVDDLAPDAVVDAVADVGPHETLGSLVERATASPRADRAGAVATFTGRVRARDGADDPRTLRLEFEKYEGVADDRLATIREDLEDRDGVHEVLLHHRTGVVAAGEDIVFVVVLAGHREEAFRAVEDGIDRLKDEVPLFKKEVTVEDEYWVHERDA